MLLALSDVTYVLIGWFKFLLLKFLYEYGPRSHNSPARIGKRDQRMFCTKQHDIMLCSFFLVLFIALKTTFCKEMKYEAQKNNKWKTNKAVVCNMVSFRCFLHWRHLPAILWRHLGYATSVCLFCYVIHLVALLIGK